MSNRKTTGVARPLLVTRSTMGCRARRGRGFTLIELMIVVTIVGVLAVIGVVGYRKLTLSAKVSEAQNMIQAIRIAQEEYKAESGAYLNVGTTFCPNDGKLQQKTGWNPACNGGSATWAALPVHTDGAVQFGYRVAAGPANVADPFTTGINLAAANATVPWYIIQAQADLNGDGVAPFTQVAATSFGNQIFTTNEGQ